MAKAPKPPTKTIAFKVPADLLARFDAHQIAKLPRLAWMRYSRTLWFTQAMEREIAAVNVTAALQPPDNPSTPLAQELQVCRRVGCGAQFPPRPGKTPKVYCSVTCRARDSEVRTGKRCAECGWPRQPEGDRPGDLDLVLGALGDLDREMESPAPNLQQCRDLLALAAVLLKR